MSGDRTIIQTVDGEPVAAYCSDCGLSVRTDEVHDCALARIAEARAASGRVLADIERRRLEAEARHQAEEDARHEAELRRQARKPWRKAWDAIWDRRAGIVVTVLGTVFVICWLMLSYYASSYEAPADGAQVAACSEVATRHFGLFGAVNVGAFPECAALSVTQQTAVQAAFTAMAEAR